MWKQFTHNGNHKWLDFLPSVEIQRESIEYIDVISTNSDKLLNTVYSSVALPIQSDSVRMSKFKTIFEKVYTPIYTTTEVFRIVKIQTNPVTYLLENYREKPITGGFY